METNLDVRSLLAKCKGFCKQQEILENIQELLNVLNEGRNVDEPDVGRRLVQLMWDIVKCESDIAGDVVSFNKTRQSAISNTHVIIFVVRILSGTFAPHISAAIFQTFLCTPLQNHLDINDVLNITRREPLSVSRPSIHHLNLTTNALVKGANLSFLISPNTEGKSLILELLDVVVKLCSDLSIPRFQATMGLLTWLDAVERLFKEGLRISNECKFVPETKEVDEIMMVVTANWESPVNGVSDLVKKIYGFLLRLHVLERQAFSAAISADLHGFLLKKTMRMPWTAKPKFQSLACLLQHVDFDKCIALDPKLPKEVIGCLSSTHLTSVASDVYRSSIAKRNKEVEKDAWTKHWKDVIADAMSSDNRVQRHNLTTHILPWTLQNVSNSFADLCATLKEDKKLKLTPLVTLSRIAKQAGIPLSTSQGKNLVQNCLHHKSTEVRAEVFGLLCSCHAKSQLPTAEEFESITKFLPDNLNVDDAWFRTEVTIHMENFIIRLRDRALTEFSRTRGQGTGNIETNETFAKIVGFIEWLVSLCIQSLYPGAGYQRMITCITILEIVFGTFSNDPKGKRKMIQRKDDLGIMLNYLWETRTRLDPTSGETRQSIMQCIFHGADDVRQVTFKILSTCIVTHASYATKLLDLAKEYMSSPKPHDTAVGATLMHLYLIHVKDDSKKLEGGMITLFDTIYKESESVQNNFVEAAQNSPAHGAVLALATCFSDVTILKALQAAGHLDTHVLNAVELARHLINHALKVMRLEDSMPSSSINDSTNNVPTSEIMAAPSFEDTNRAFLELVNAWESVHRQLSDYEQQILLEKMSSCSWLCIKNSCKLLEEVTRAWSEDNGVSISLSSETIKQIDAKFVDVLFECRHRGAIESCYESYRAFCRLIALSEDAEIAGLPFENLRRLLLQVVRKTKSASVTRRSAGLPLLKRALVESKPDNSQHSLLAYAVDELEKAARSPLSEMTGLDQEVDLIQAEALHILCSLVGAASLSSAMLPHLGRILRLTVDMLSAPRWVIVNAAHQLYGAVMPRLLGQKKTKEIVGHNTMTAAELFSRYPDLCVQFLSCLTEDKLCGRKDTMFVLDFLSRLTPTAFTSKEQDYLNPFLKCLDNHLTCDSWAQRLLAAKCYRLLCTPSCSQLRRLLDALTGEDHCSTNRMQAGLHLANLLLRDNPHLATDLGSIYEGLLTSRFAWMLSKGYYLVCVEFLEFLERILPQRESQWRHLLYENFLEDKTHQPNQTKQHLKAFELPGRSMWKVAHTKWLLKSNGGWLQTNFLRILAAAEHDQDVMEGILENLTEEIGKSWLCFSTHMLQQVAVTLVHYCSKRETYRTLKIRALGVLETLFEMEGVVEETLLSDCCKLSKDHATKEVPGGTTVQALSLLLWAVCIKHMISMPYKMESAEVLDELHQWSSIVSCFCQWKVDEVFRLNAARSLKTVGHPLLGCIAEYNPLPTKIIYSLFSSILSLLQDENEEARKHVADMFGIATEDGHLIPVQPNIAIKELFKWLLSTCKGRSDLVMFLTDQLKSENPTDVEVMRLSRPNNGLFEQEDANFYAEPLVIVALVKEYVRISISEVADDDKDALCRHYAYEGLNVLNEAEKTLVLLKARQDDLASLEGQMLGENRLHLPLSMLHARMCTCLLVLKAAENKDAQVMKVVTGLESQRMKLLEVWAPQLPLEAGFPIDPTGDDDSCRLYSLPQASTATLDYLFASPYANDELSGTVRYQCRSWYALRFNSREMYSIMFAEPQDKV
ncbi:uncharacterized protein LOC135396912 isoform X2 [Ornithodoros turicata]|uniref:uncharacterized protein LOC135396912 isoform X2 n=1 Tax=Ornithodoros turicata TaxID=34597 RepID=UPI003139CB88